ncbi:type II toxin-antitoxin system VapC family toxin [Thermococcus sp. 9N3]|uniref:type II toxin-antitoxin system VapC family toxin n=1 Tax=Thermococcus sp. 9N3 TaxID=163002 RepID=UPI00143212E2|nr:type II toxin-antitoxin system VapC family toxin [Thermococcus sp. 9N3]NJE48825.1 PIN domain-containing protein [Thermococcus sp. 9N3]
MSTFSRELVMVDSNVWIDYLLGEERGVELMERLVSEYNLAITPTIYGEVVFQLLARNYTKLKGSYKFYSLRKELSKNPDLYKPVDTFDELLTSLLASNALVFLDETWEVVRLSREIRKKFGLLPNDSLIASACEYYGIGKIATFDDDFLRTSLEVLR